MNTTTMNGKINRQPTEAWLDLTYEDLVWLRAEWLAACTVTALTRTGYRQKTRYLIEWWRDYGPTVDWRLTKRHVAKFDDWLCGQTARYTGTTLTWWTRQDALRRTGEMLKWAQAQNIIEGIDMRGWLREATGEPPERKAATVAQLGQLMEAAGQSRYPLRDQALIAFFVGTGCRREEVQRLQVQDIVFSTDGSGTAAIVGKRTSANKSGRRSVGFGAFTGCFIKNYLNEMGISEGPVWISRSKQAQLSQNGIYKMVKNAIRKAGLQGSLQACHDLRRAFATILAKMHPDSPGWTDIIRRQLGHKHYRQTTEYVLLDGDDLRARIASPLCESGDK